MLLKGCWSLRLLIQDKHQNVDILKVFNPNSASECVYLTEVTTFTSFAPPQTRAGHMRGIHNQQVPQLANLPKLVFAVTFSHTTGEATVTCTETAPPSIISRIAGSPAAWTERRICGKSAARRSAVSWQLWVHRNLNNQKCMCTKIDR